MILKERVEKDELKILRSLDARTTLSEAVKTNLISSEKGYQGELKFDQWAIPLHKKMVFLNDLLIEYQGSPFQVDSCAFASNTIFHFEVKNFEGDYRIKDGMWINPLGKEIKDPLLQMKRAESLIRQQAQKLGFNPLVESYLIFVNPEFYLYNPPDNQSIIYPAQLNRFMKKLQNRSLKVSKLDIKLAEKLLALHINESPYSRLPEYKFEDLRKGILCFNCRRFYHTVEGRSLVCDYCGGKENNQIAILRTVQEFQLLFPHEKLTTNKIHTMCGGIYENRTVRKVLLDNFEIKGFGQHSYYVKGGSVSK